MVADTLKSEILIFYILNIMYNKFCIVNNFGSPAPVSWQEIKELMRSAQVVNTCKALAALNEQDPDYQKKKTTLKKDLPCMTVHSCYFESEKRQSNNAYWNGMVCLEYDDLSSDQVEALRKVEPPSSQIKLAGMSCSGHGVWFLIEVANSDYSEMKHTYEMIHEAYCSSVLREYGLDIRECVDRSGLDLARLRFLPSYDYIWWETIDDFSTQEEQAAGYVSMYGDLMSLCAGFDRNISEGQRHTAYK
jgi:hypothetical protein